MKLCKDCRHRTGGVLEALVFGAYMTHRCGRAKKIDLVSGKEELSFCTTQRMFSHCCGEEGKYWEPKE